MNSQYVKYILGDLTKERNKNPSNCLKTYHFIGNDGEGFKNTVRAKEMVLAVKALAA